MTGDQPVAEPMPTYTRVLSAKLITEVNSLLCVWKSLKMGIFHNLNHPFNDKSAML